MSTVVYRTKCSAWMPERFQEGIPGYGSLDKVYHTLNPHENTLVVVTTKRVPVEWAQIDEIHNWDWQLYVLHWDQARGLLFIHNSSNAGFFKRLAEAVAGEAEQVRGAKIFRCLSGINRLKLQNVGLLEQLGRLIRYTMRAGSDVESGISEVAETEGHQVEPLRSRVRERAASDYRLFIQGAHLVIQDDQSPPVDDVVSCGRRQADQRDS